jgi:hypothetical protein
MKPRFILELDSKVQPTKDIVKERDRDRYVDRDHLQNKSKGLIEVMLLRPLLFGKTRYKL